MREIISLHVGQAGSKVGDQCWDLYGLEHEISEDGSMSENSDKKPEPSGVKSFYNESEKDRYVPRAIFVDTGSESINELRTGHNRDLYDGARLISGKEDASSCFARGKFTMGRNVEPQCQEEIRKLAEECGNLQGFFLFNAVGGGTGSGLGTLLLDKLGTSFKKKHKVAFTVFPSDKSSAACIEPYNSVFSTSALVNHADSVVMLDNEAIYRVCREKLRLGKDVPYSNLNKIVSQVVSSMTLSTRFDGMLNVDLDQFHTNLVPYPKLHFMLSSLAPLAPMGTEHFQGNTATQVTVDAFHPKAMMVDCDPGKGHYMASCLMYRGAINPSNVSKAIENIKKRKKFVDWCPTGFKVGINWKPQMKLEGDGILEAPCSATMIGNNTAITDVFTRIDKKYDMMYKRRAFVHWYIKEGMEEGEFPDARENIDQLREDYQEVIRVETALQSPQARSPAFSNARARESPDEISDF